MKPELVLNIKDGEQKDPAVVRDLWIAEYDAMAKWDLSTEELCEQLKERVTKACEIYISRKTPKVRASFAAPDPYYYEWLDEMRQKEDDSLDGDFPLGNAHDAEFANDFFSLEELVYIQCGHHNLISTGHYVEYADRVLLRKGFIAELEEDWPRAVGCYSGISYSSSAQEREFECDRKRREEGEKCYAQAQELMGSGKWSEVSVPLYRAADMGHPDAMVDLALANIYGQYGIRKCMDEALELLHKAVWENSARACFELVELYDSGVGAVDAEEALSMCEKAAKLGHKKAAARLEDGFDLRPIEEILREQAQKGNADAMWQLAKHLAEKQENEEAGYWYDQAYEAGQVDVLMEFAAVYLDKDGEYYDERMAEQCLRRAADQGCVRAIITLSELELKEGDENFWQAAMKISQEKPGVFEKRRHQRQFAWYQLAAEAGDGDAMNALCAAYHFGYPIERDDVMAFEWVMKAVDQRNESAMYQAAYLLENGFGTKKNIEEALKLYTESAEKGVASSMMRLYQIYSEGLEHIQPDKEKASRYLWLSGVGRS